MEALASLLDAPRARGAFLLRVVVDPPWGIRVADQAPITLAGVRRGTVWVMPRDGEPVRLGPGDVAVLRGPEPYRVADAPETAWQIEVVPGGCAHASADGADLCESMTLGVRTWGTNPDGATVMLVGTYQMREEVSRRLLGALPSLLVLRAGDTAWDGSLLPLLDAQIAQDGPGQEVVLDRMLDLLLISALRASFARPGADAPAWFQAQGDPVVGRALQLIHDQPAHPWTVAALAARSGVSRAGLARRFTALVGEPPMAYLTSRRLALAAELLREPETTLEAVARRVGYGSAFAFSAAFKRERGLSPSAYRERREREREPVG